MAYKKLANGEIEIIPEQGHWDPLPLDVRVSKELCPNAKLLYASIVGLAKERGYSFKPNTGFADDFGVTTRHVSKWIAQLEKAGFIYVVKAKSGKEKKHRRIYPICVPHLYCKNDRPKGL